MFRIYISSILFLIVSPTSAQKFELDKVTKEQLEQKYHPKDTSVVAAILFKKAKTYFDYSGQDGFVSLTEVDLKIKIYKPEGYSCADMKIPYYVGYEEISDEEVKIESAYTYNLVGNSIEKTKVTKESKFDNQLNFF